MSSKPNAIPAGALPQRVSSSASSRISLAVATGAALCISVPAPASAALPDIRTSFQNPVPQCATPERLMAFATNRNGRLDPRFRDIARHYRRHGEHWRVRWDYAFFQMLVETNYLTFRKPGGGRGDADAVARRSRHGG